VKGYLYRQTRDGTLAIRYGEDLFAVCKPTSTPLPPGEGPKHGDRFTWEGERPGKLEVRNLSTGASLEVMAQEFGLTWEALRSMGLFTIRDEPPPPWSRVWNEGE